MRVFKRTPNEKLAIAKGTFVIVTLPHHTPQFGIIDGWDVDQQLWNVRFGPNGPCYLFPRNLIRQATESEIETWNGR